MLRHVQLITVAKDILKEFIEYQFSSIIGLRTISQVEQRYDFVDPTVGALYLYPNLQIYSPISFKPYQGFSCKCYSISTYFGETEIAEAFVHSCAKGSETSDEFRVIHHT